MKEKKNSWKSEQAKKGRESLVSLFMKSAKKNFYTVMKTEHIFKNTAVFAHCY
jgi:hypothetical protein